MISVDKAYASEIVETIPFLEMSPPAARSILSSIVSAMVSTTGVVFSITIVALSLSSTHFGSRLIRTYRKRRTTHFTLGILVSTSLFCILVLSSIREVDGTHFVPVTSVGMGILMSAICLATLVYYIHDMSRAIEAPNVIQSSADDLHQAIERMFPESVGKSANSPQAEPSNINIDTTDDFKVMSDQIGYVQVIEHETLMSMAERYDLVVRLEIRPGDFVHQEQSLATICENGGKSERGGQATKGQAGKCDEITESIKRSIVVGPERTHVQDVRYAFNEIAEIAIRALSPGVNDPFTAINCIDQIHAALLLLRKRKIPDKYRVDRQETLRLIAESATLDECLTCSLLVIQPYAANDPVVKNRIETVLEELNA